MSNMEAFPETLPSPSAVSPAAAPTLPSPPYETPAVLDLGAWQVVTGSLGIPCDPFTCDVEF